MKRPYLHEIFLLTGLFLAGIAVNSVVNIAEETKQIRIDLASFSQKVIDHDRRIGTLERKLP